MKIALVTARPNANKQVGKHVFWTEEKRPPHGIGYLYSVLREAGHAQIDIYDRYCNPNAWPKCNFKSYDFLGLYCASICTDDISHILCNSQAWIHAVGGPHASLHPGWFLDNWADKVAYIVRGEAEPIIGELIYGRPRPGVWDMDRMSNADLDRIPRFPWEKFWDAGHINNYKWDFPFHTTRPVFTMNTSRGCPFSCGFCSVKKIWGRQLTMQSASRIIDDISYIRSLGGRGIYFREDNFTVSPTRVAEMCELMLSKNLGMKWACETRVDTIDEELMAKMAQAGCIGFFVGVEHGSQKILDFLNKGITVEQIEVFFERTHKYNINTAASFITHHPEENNDDRAARKRLLSKIRPTVVWDNPYREDG